MTEPQPTKGMKSRRRRRAPKSQTLSMDWFIPASHIVHSPLNNPPIEEGLLRDRSPLPSPLLLLLESNSVESVDNSLEDDPRGCHSNLAEHLEGVNQCRETLRGFGIHGTYQFLELWTTDEILTALDTMAGLEMDGCSIKSPRAWLWNHLARRPDDETL